MGKLMQRRLDALPVALLLLLILERPGAAQIPDYARRAVELSHEYRVIPNVIYHTANNYDAKLDVYTPYDTTRAVPTVIFIHGGAWYSGSKEEDALYLLPYLAMGWAAVNVEYRLARVSPAPAAVEDCMCALSWVVQHAKQYHFDPKRLVLTGYSSGGHLALTSAMIPPSAGFHRECPDSTTIKVAAVVNWFGITDVADLLRGPNQRAWAKAWLAHTPSPYELAVRVSPLTYVRYGGPPVITIQGDEDEIVPYSQSVRLHRALDKRDVPNRLVTLYGAGHGGFTPHEMTRAYAAIFDFLRERGLPTADATPVLGVVTK